MVAVNSGEYWNIIGYRDYWAQELTNCARAEAQLEEQLARLADTWNRLRIQRDQIGQILFALDRVPSDHSLWKGARAEQTFQRCTEGELHAIYREAQIAVETVMQRAEEKRQELLVRLHSVQDHRFEADCHYRYFCERELNIR